MSPWTLRTSDYSCPRCVLGSHATINRTLRHQAFYLAYYAAGAFILPYYNLFFKHLGISGANIGLIAALRPWLSAPATSLWGWLADRYAIHRPMLLLTLAASTITRCCMALPLFNAQFATLLAVVLLTEAIQGPPTMLVRRLITLLCFVCIHAHGMCCTPPHHRIRKHTHTHKETTDKKQVDTATMATVRNDHEYGKQRLWGTLGWGLLSPLAGWAVGRFGVGCGGFTGYAIGSVVCFATCLAIDFAPLYGATKQGTSHGASDAAAPLLDDSNTARHGGHADDAIVVVEDAIPTYSLTQVLCRPATIAWLLLSVTMGYGIGAIEGFFFLYLDDLGAHPLLMGVDLAVTCAAEAPVFFLSSYLYRHVSVATALQIVLLAYIVRMGAYVALPLLPSPWCILPVDLLHGVTFGVGWSAGTIQVMMAWWIVHVMLCD